MAPGDKDAITTVVSPVVDRAGFDLENLSVRAAGGTRIVRVVIDRDGGVDLDDAARLSRELSAILDERADGAFRGRAYTLEVTSRGATAPLTAPRHFRRAAGHPVRLAMNDGTTLRGRIVTVEGTRLVLLVGEGGLDRREVPLTDIARGTVEIEFAAPSAAVRAVLDQARAPATVTEDTEERDQP